jgi:hypothetical protein
MSGLYTANEVDTELAVKVSLSDVKADTDIADALSKKHINSLDHDGATQDTVIAGKAAVSHTHAPGDVTGTAVVTNDGRLSDAREPLSHAHSESEITNLVSDLSGKLATSAFVGLAKITVGISQPGAPSVGDFWIDTN